MAQVSLIATGAKLGKTTGTVSLAALRTDGFTRTIGADDYLRVNPFEVEAGRAQDPNEAGTEHRLGDWLNYTHDNLVAGDDLAVVGGYGTVDLSWARPGGYANAAACLSQRYYIKDTGSSVIDGTSLSVNPFSSPDQQADVGDVESVDDVNVASYEGNVIAIGVKLEFDDSDTVYTNADGTAYDAAAGEDVLIGAGVGIAMFVFPSNPGPLSAVQTTDPDSCIAGADVNLQISYAMLGPSTGRLEQSVNGGAFTLVDAAVSAGSTTINLSRASTNSYVFRLRYNDVSPDQWATSSSVSAVCNLA